MKVLSFEEPEIWSVFKVLASLLHLGNVKYQVSTSHNLEKTEVRDPLNVGRIAKLLEVSRLYSISHGNWMRIPNLDFRWMRKFS